MTLTHAFWFLLGLNVCLLIANVIAFMRGRQKP